MSRPWCAVCPRYDARKGACRRPGECRWEYWTEDRSVAIDRSGSEQGGLAEGNRAAFLDGGSWKAAWIKWKESAPGQVSSRALDYETAVLERLRAVGYATAPTLLLPFRQDRDGRGVERAWYAMSRAEGRTWDRAKPEIQANPRRPLAALCAALVELHRHGFGHHDLKPKNIFWNNAGGRVTLIDFGSSKGPEDWRRADDRHRNKGIEENVANTPPWVAPEAYSKAIIHLTPEADSFVFALLFAQAICRLSEEEILTKAVPGGLPTPGFRDKIRAAVSRMGRGHLALATIVADRLLAQDASARRGALESALAEMDRLGWSRTLVPPPIKPAEDLPQPVPGNNAKEPTGDSGKKFLKFLLFGLLAAAVLGLLAAAVLWLVPSDGSDEDRKNQPKQTNKQTETGQDKVDGNVPPEDKSSDPWKDWLKEWSQIKRSSERHRRLSHLSDGWQKFSEEDKRNFIDKEQGDNTLWPQITIKVDDASNLVGTIGNNSIPNSISFGQGTPIQPGSSSSNMVSATIKLWLKNEDEVCGWKTNVVWSRFEDRVVSLRRSDVIKPKPTWTILVPPNVGNPTIRYWERNRPNRMNSATAGTSFEVEPHQAYYASVVADGYMQTNLVFAGRHRGETQTNRVVLVKKPEPPPDPNLGRPEFKVVSGFLDSENYLFKWKAPSNCYRMNQGKFTWEDVQAAADYEPKDSPITLSLSQLEIPKGLESLFNDLISEGDVRSDQNLSLSIKKKISGNLELSVTNLMVGEATTVSTIYAVTPDDLVKYWNKKLTLPGGEAEVRKELAAVLKYTPSWTNKLSLIQFWGNHMRLWPIITITGTDGISYRVTNAEQVMENTYTYRPRNISLGGSVDLRVEPTQSAFQAPTKTKTIRWNDGSQEWKLEWTATPTSVDWKLPVKPQDVRKMTVNGVAVDSPKQSISLQPGETKTVVLTLIDRTRAFRVSADENGKVLSKEQETEQWIQLENTNSFPVTVGLANNKSLLISGNRSPVYPPETFVDAPSPMQVTAENRTPGWFNLPSLTSRINPDPVRCSLPILKEPEPEISYPDKELRTIADNYSRWLKTAIPGSRNRSKVEDLWDWNSTSEDISNEVQTLKTAFEYFDKRSKRDNSFIKRSKRDDSFISFSDNDFEKVKNARSEKDRVQAILRLYGCQEPPK